MSESEIFVCKHCGEEHEALTQEIGSYQCPKLRKPKGKVKMLDEVMKKSLTEIINSSETQDPNTIKTQDEDLYGEESKIISESSTDRDARTHDNQASNSGARGKSE